GVQVMTVHKAKGLEFPVVILADPTCPAAPQPHVEPCRRLWLEPLCGCAPAQLLEAADEELRRDRAEEMRVVYGRGNHATGRGPWSPARSSRLCGGGGASERYIGGGDTAPSAGRAHFSFRLIAWACSSPRWIARWTRVVNRSSICSNRSRGHAPSCSS